MIFFVASKDRLLSIFAEIFKRIITLGVKYRSELATASRKTNDILLLLPDIKLNFYSIASQTQTCLRQSKQNRPID
jgi:hypothetical protein